VMLTIAFGSLFFFWRRGWLKPSYRIKEDWALGLFLAINLGLV
jgi:hypothetical protein